mmetsp:Transcript_11305/g.17490  ORF Transcript_11305/g.17490 Transcript_11305/m.17490 type:complete len:319 (-) Transcript_11305:140-1096(-)
MTSGPYNDNPKPNPRRTSTERHSQAQNLYYPSIFRYKCRGAFHVSSGDTGSAGVCQGIQSRLEHVRDLQRSTRDEAASAFLSAANYPTDLPEEGDTPHAEALQSLLQTQALIYDEHNKEESTNTKRHEPDPVNPWNDWSCYGSTEVHLLVLRDVSDNKETVAGVAPECALGLSIRDVGTPTSGGVVGTIRMGPLEVNLVGDYYDEQNPSTADSRQQHHHKSNRSNSALSSTAPYSQPATTTKADTNVEFYEKFMKASEKLSNSMQHNAHFLKNELSDEFPSRMVDGAKRVVGQFEKTADRTLKLMKSVYHMWRDDHED